MPPKTFCTRIGMPCYYPVSKQLYSINFTTRHSSMYLKQIHQSINKGEVQEAAQEEPESTSHVHNKPTPTHSNS